MFQFHNGTIKTFVSKPRPASVPKFQFHNGTIKTDGAPILYTERKEFQFHNGTIKTSIVCGSVDRLIKFQFHNGTIKTMIGRQKYYYIGCFNSITVQLRPIKYSKKTSNNKQVIQ